MLKCNICDKLSVVLCSLDMYPAWYYLKCMNCGAHGAGSKNREDAEKSLLTKRVEP